MLFNLKCLIALLHLHADVDIKRFSCLCCLLIVLPIYCKLRIISILHPASLIFFIQFQIHTFRNEFIIKFIQQVKFTCQIHHWASLSLFVYHKQRRNAGSFCHKSIISTECRSNMNNTCTVFCCYIITGDYSECLRGSIFPSSCFFIQLYRFNPRH